MSRGLFGKLLSSRITVTIIILFLVIAVWFGIAGRADWIQGWIFLLVYLIFVIALYLRMRKNDPDLAEERIRSSKDAEPWDRWLMTIYVVLVIGMLFLAALDSGRYGWSRVPLLVQLVGWCLLILCGAILWHVMAINPYLSSYARIQDDRGQVVVKEGLYSRLRHPMYLGLTLAFLGMPLALGSWWALIPGLIIACLFVYRTYREDQMLITGLPGYVAYTEEVPYRLLPGIW